MSGTELLLSPYWFLIEMLFSSSIFILLYYLAKRIYVRFNNKECEMMLMGVILFSLITLSCLSITQLHVPKISIRTFLAIIYLALGYLWKLYHSDPNLFIAIGSLLLLALVLKLSPIHIGSPIDGGMQVLDSVSAILYLIVSLLGIYGCWGVLYWISSMCRLRLLTCLGAKSMEVLTWHYLGIAISLNILTALHVQQLPAFKFPLGTSSCWIVISVSAILISLCFSQLELLVKKALIIVKIEYGAKKKCLI